MKILVKSHYKTYDEFIIKTDVLIPNKTLDIVDIDKYLIELAVNYQKTGKVVFDKDWTVSSETLPRRTFIGAKPLYATFDIMVEDGSIIEHNGYIVTHVESFRIDVDKYNRIYNRYHIDSNFSLEKLSKHRISVVEDSNDGFVVYNTKVVLELNGSNNFNILIKNNGNETTWNTNDILSFINHLKSHSESKKFLEVITYLNKYKKSTWQLDDTKIRESVNSLLNKMILSSIS